MSYKTSSILSVRNKKEKKTFLTYKHILKTITYNTTKMKTFFFCKQNELKSLQTDLTKLILIWKVFQNCL